MPPPSAWYRLITPCILSNRSLASVSSACRRFWRPASRSSWSWTVVAAQSALWCERHGGQVGQARRKQRGLGLPDPQAGDAQVGVASQPLADQVLQPGVGEERRPRQGGDGRGVRGLHVRAVQPVGLHLGAMVGFVDVAARQQKDGAAKEYYLFHFLTLCCCSPPPALQGPVALLVRAFVPHAWGTSIGHAWGVVYPTRGV